MPKSPRPAWSALSNRARLEALTRRNETRKRSRRQLRLDSLEDRTAPAVGTVQFQLATSSSAEGTTPLVEVRLQTTDTVLNGDVIVGVTDAGGGTASPGGVDYNLAPGGTVTFNSSTPFTIEGGDRVYRLNIAVDNPSPAQSKILTVTDDRRVEASETARFQLSVVGSASDAITLQSGGNLIHTLTVTDNDSATVSVPTGVTTDSENPGFVPVTATLNLTTTGTGPEELAVPVSANLPAGNPDYVATGVTFNPGDVNGATADIHVDAVDDQRIEASTEAIPGQALAITATGGANVTAAGVQEIDVADNDLAIVTIAPPASLTLAEGASGGVPVTLFPITTGTGPVGLDVPLTVSLPGNPDYTPTGFTFTPGDLPGPAPGAISVLAVDDNLVEPTETFPAEPLAIATQAAIAPIGTESITIVDNDTATFSIGDVTVNEGAGTATFTVSLDKPIDTDVTINVNYADATATGGADYDPSTDSLTFPAGSTASQTVTVAINDDNIVEATETFLASLSTPTSLGDRSVNLTDTATGTILDNDTGTFAIDDVTVNEGAGTLTFTVSLSNPIDIPVLVNVNYGGGTATGGVDYDSGTDTLVFPAGSTASQTVTVAINDDNIVEATETFIASLSTPTPLGGRSLDLSDTGTGTITDNDTATFSIDDVTVAEGGTATFTVTLSNPLDIPIAIDVNYGAGTAAGGVDYDSGTDTLVFPAGSTASQTVTVSTVNDNLVEAIETFVASLSTSTPLGGRSVDLSDTGAGTITDNDTATFAINDVTVNEAAGTATFTVSLSNPIDIPINVDISYGGGTATGGGVDYDSSTDTAAFAAGSTAAQTVTVAITNDNLVEAAETFLASLDTATALGGRSVDLSDTATGTITDNDTGTFTINDVTVNEGAGTATFTVSLSNPIDTDVNVDVNYGGGSATGGGVDYDSSTDSLTFAAGSTAAQTVTVAINDDNIVEATETFLASLSTPTALGGRSVSTTDTGTGTIADNDSAAFTIDDVTVTEGGTATFTVSLNNPTDIPITINVNYGSGTATGGADYDSATDTLTFPAGSTTSQTVTVSTVDDNLVEATENFIASLSTPTALSDRNLSLTDTGTGTITDNDAATLTVNDVTVAEGGTATFTVSLDKPFDIPVTLNVSYGGGTATGGGADYDSGTDQVTFAAGSTAAQTVTVAINDDNIVEATETFLAGLSSATALGDRNVDLSDTATGTITDNDTATFAINDVTVNEGAGTATFTVSLSNPIDIPVAIDVNYADQTATGGGVDYDSSTDTANFAALSTGSQTVTVAINNDNLVEIPIETFLASLGTSTALGGRSVVTSDTGTGTITENDRAVVTFSGTANLAEGNATPGLVTATLSLVTDGTGTAALDVPVSATVGSPTSDFTASTVTWAAGEAPSAKSIAVTVIDDRTVEQAAESLAGNLITNSAGLAEAAGSATVNVTDNDTAAVSIAGGTTTVAEGGPAQSVVATLTLTATGTGPVQLGVPISVTLPGNADYTAAPATFNAGATSGATASIAVSAVDDAIVEAAETFPGQGVSATGDAAVSVGGSQTIAVTDNDTATFTIDDASATEGGTITFTVSLDKPLDIPITINVSYGGGTAAGGADYDSTAGSVTFAAGSTAPQTVTVATADDTIDEPAETFTASLGTSTALGGRTVSLSDTGTGTILDNDDGAPTVGNRSLTLAEDTSLGATLSATDPDNDPVTFAVVTGPAHGTVNLDPQTGSFTYTPAANYNGADAFAYKANDGTLDSNVGTVTITVTAVNDAPVATGGAAAGDEDAALTGNVSATDVDGDALTYAVVTGPSHGTLTAFNPATGAFTYTPAANYNGADSFTFRANDGTADSNTATFAITVNPVNDAPVANPASVSTNEDTTLVGSVSATDADGDTLTYSLLSPAAHGTVTVNSNGTFTYTPNANYNGPDAFAFTANDGTVDSGIGVVNVTVTAVNDAPVATNGSGSTNEDVGFAGSVSAADADGDTLTYSVVTGPAHGSLTLNPDGSFTYTPAANYNGADGFTFKANDGTADSNPATFSITVSAANDAPVAAGATFSTNEDAALVATASATDVDGDALTYSLVAGPTHGTVTVNPSGLFTYTPAANYNGPDSFTFKANDGTVDSNTATVTITVAPVNDAPAAANGNASTNEDTALTGNVAATDADGDTLTYAAVTGPAHGSLALNPDGSFTYTPAANYNGSDSFTFKANDGSADSNTATFAITVVSTNDPPAAADGTASTNEDTTLIGSVSATDADGNALTYSLVSGAAHGTVTVNGSGTFVYTPAANYNGPDSFTFKANDGTADSNTATVTVTVTPVNDAPAAANGSATTNEDTAVSGTVVATDIDSPTLTYSVVTGPAHGSLALNPDGSFTYTPAANYNGPDAFTFKANDGAADSNTATVTLTVAAVNDNPTATADGFSVAEDSPPAVLNVLANDSIAPDTGETLTVTGVTQGANGTVAIVSGGTAVSYKPNANYNGPDTFTYTVSDGNGGAATAAVTVNVVSANDLPTAGNDTATVVEDSGANTIDVLANDSFSPDVGETLTVGSVTQGAHGTVAIGPGGLSVTYTPAADYAGPDTFTYTVSDGNGGTAVATVAVDVTEDAADRLEVVTTPGVTTYTEAVPPAVPVAVAVDAGIRVGPGLEGVMSSATVRFGTGYVPGKDRLVFTPLAGNPIRGGFTVTTGVLTLRGVATQQQYQDALRSVKFINTSPLPVDGLRTVTFQLRDAAGLGTTAARLVRVVGVNTAPKLTLATTPVAYTRGRLSVAVAGNLTIKDVDNTRLQSAQVRLTGFTPGKDLLTAILKPGITKTFDATTGILTLTGNATIAAYLAVLRSIRFSAPADAAAGPRTVSITVNDGGLDSNIVTRTVNVA
jgi:VCBS repeat-containing protein